MKQLGNLAIVCAKRKDIVFLIMNGLAHVLVFDEEGNELENARAKWDDDQTIQEICHKLNFGRFARGDAQ